MLFGDHPYIAKRLKWHVLLMLNHYCIYARTNLCWDSGWVRKSSKLRWGDIRMVPTYMLYFAQIGIHLSDGKVLLESNYFLLKSTYLLLHSPFGPIISIDEECSFSLHLVVSPPITITSELSSFSRGHTSFSHNFISSAAPSQVPRPGNFSRTRFTLPPPQVLVHSLQSVHADHWQPKITSIQ